MSDIVERLRARAWRFNVGQAYLVTSQAADEIEQLRKDRAELIGTLETLADTIQNCFETGVFHASPHDCHDLREARALIAQRQKEPGQ